MSGRPPELLTVSIPLGPLTYAVEASADVFHVQDPKTRQFHALPMNKKPTTPSFWYRFKRIFTSPLFALVWRWVKLSILATLLAVVAYVLAGVGMFYKDDVLRRLNQVVLVWTTPIAQPVTKLDVPSVAQVASPYPMPFPMSVVPDVAVKPNATQDSREITSKPKENKPAKEESLIVMNESPPEAEPKKSESSQSTHPKKADSPAPSAIGSVKKSPPSIAYKPQLVAIQDEATVLVTSPTSRIPVKVVLGSKLPDGRTVTKIDLQNGVVSLESGTPIRLE
jgi:hypothetical protein